MNAYRFCAPWRMILCAVLGVLLSSTIAPIHAANKTWDGDSAPDGNWLTPPNWDNNTLPNSADLLFFGGTVNTSTTNDFGAGTVFNNIIFNSGAAGFTLYGNSLVLTNGTDAGAGTTAGGGITNASANPQTLKLPLTLSPGKHNVATVAGSGPLNLAGPVTLSPGVTAVFTKSGGNINLAGSGITTNDFNNILGGWATMGADWATLDATGNVIPYSGYVIVAPGGTIANAPASNVKISAGSATAITTASGVCDINSLIYSAGSATQPVNPPVGSTLRLGAKGGIFNATGFGTVRALTIGSAAGVGILTAGGAPNTPGEITIYDSPFTATPNNVTINSLIANNGSGVVSLNIIGYVILGTANSYSGGTFINQGRIQASAAGCFGTGPVYVYPGGHIFLNANGPWANDFYITGVGSTESAGLGVIRMGGGRVISGKVTLLGPAAIGMGNSTTPAITGKITGPGSLIIGNGSTANGAGTLTIGNGASSTPNDYAGDTIINNSTVVTAPNILKIAAASPAIMPHGVGKGNVVLTASSATITATFDLNGTTQIINGLNSSATSPANNFVTSSAGAAVLTVGDNDANGNFNGIIQNGAGNMSLTKIGAGTQTLGGANTYSGATLVSAGKLVTTTASTGAGAYSVADSSALAVRVASAGSSLNMSSLTLGSASTLQIDTGSLGAPSVAPINVAGNLALNGTVSVNLLGTALTPGTFTILQYTGARSGAGSFVLVTSPRTVGTIAEDVDNKRVTVTISSIDSSIAWLGGISGTWDINNSANTIWQGVPSGGTTFYVEDPTGNDVVRFDDSATGTTSVDLSTVLSPLGITVNNSTLPYTFTGSGKLSGNAALSKQGTGTLILDNVGSNDFSGGVTISAGTLQVGSADARGNLPAAGSVVDNAALTFARSDSLTVGNVISGNGTLTKQGAGVLTLSGANTFTGITAIVQGTVKAGNALALGTTAGETIVSDGATLDVNHLNLGQERIIVIGAGVGGAGAIVDNSGNPGFVAPSLANVTLSGDTVFGGTGRWDLRSNPTTTINASLSTGGNAYNLIKVGNNQVSLVSVQIDPGLRDIEIKNGLLSLEVLTTSMGDPYQNLIVHPGATLSFFNTTSLWNKVYMLYGDGVTPSVTNWSGSNTMVGPINLDGDCVFGVAGTVLTSSGGIVGPGNLIKQGTSPLVLAGENSYSGSTTVSNGTILVNGSVIGGGPVNVPTGTLGGSGAIGSSVTIGPNGTIAPGSIETPLGALEIDFSLVLQGTNSMDVNKSPSGLNCDQIVFVSDLTFGGTLKLNITGDPLAPGDVIPLYVAFGASGDFANIIPASPGPGLAWDRSQLTVDGTLRVTTVAPLVWSGLPNGNWDIAGTLNWLNGGSSSSYHDGDSVQLDDSATGETNVNLTATLIPGSLVVSNAALQYSFIGTGKVSGTAGLSKKGPGMLIIANSGSNDYSGGTIIADGTLQVGAGGTSGNLPLGNVTDNGALAFKRSDNLTLSNVLSGSGVLLQNGGGTITIPVTNTHSGGLILNAGAVRLTASGAPGTGTPIVKSNSTLVAAAVLTNSFTMSGGTLGSTANFTNQSGAELRATAGTTSTVQTADPQNPSTTVNLVVAGTLSGSGDIVILNATNVASPDGGQGFRLQGTTASDFSGTVTFSNNVKGELQTTVAGPFSPGGSGKFVMVCGAFNADNTQNGPISGGYSEFNLRNNGAGNTVLGNYLELAGSGLAVLNPLGSAPAGSVVAMGSLKLGGGQELGLYLASGNTHVVTFNNVTLTGGNARFSPKTPGFGAVASVGSDLTLGDITEQSPGSGIIMAGLRTLTLTGSNTYSGSTMVNSGTMALTGSGSISRSSTINVASGATLNVSGRSDGTLTLDRTLKGNGTVVGNVVLENGGEIAPGASVGTLTISGSLTVGNGAAVAVELNSTTSSADRIVVNGLSFDGGQKLRLVDLGSATLPLGTSFTIIDNTSANPVSGTFLLWPEGTALVAGPNTYRISYVGGTGNDVVLTVSDVVPPVINCPPPVSVQCDSDVPPPNFVGGSVSDDHDTAPVVTHVGDAAIGTCPKIITRTYKATDASGNSATCTQAITVHDTIAPTINCPADVVVGANDGCNAINVPLGAPVTSDNCGVASVNNNAPATFTFGTNFVTWTVLDSCGNSNGCVQRVIVIDPATPAFTSQPQSRTNNLGTPATFTVAVGASCGPVTFAWYFNGDLLPGETSATLTISSVQLANAGSYTVKASNSAGTTTSDAAILTVNRLPIAQDDGAATTKDHPISLPVAKLLNNDNDPDGDTLTVSSISATSTNGASVILASGEVTYTPQAGFSGLDRFSYTISDGRGGEATAQVEIFVSEGALPADNAMTVEVVGSQIRISFAGIAGQTYQLQRNTTLNPGDWSTIDTRVAPLHGVIEFSDGADLSGAFYRVAKP